MAHALIAVSWAIPTNKNTTDLRQLFPGNFNRAQKNKYNAMRHVKSK